MSKNKKFKKPKIQTSNAIGIGKDKEILQTLSNTMIFSFKYVSFQNPKFQVEDRKTNYFLCLIGRFQGLSHLGIDILTSDTKNKALRSHPIDWDDSRVTEKCFGIPNENEIAYMPWQFELTVNEHGRIHGFLIGNIFNIVWFDPCHNLYPEKS